MQKKDKLNLLLGEELLLDIQYSSRIGSGRRPFNKAVFSNGISLDINEFGKFVRLIKAGRILEAKAFIQDPKLFEVLNAQHRKNSARKGGIAAMKNTSNHVQNRQFTHWSKGTTGKVTAWNKGLTGCINISKSKTGTKNPMFGKPVSSETRLKLSVAAKNNILLGKWTPNTFNSRTRKRLLFRGKLFRSSWEVLFHQAFPEMHYEQLRIPYTTDAPHVYITDFVKDNVIYEIKPLKMINEKRKILDLVIDWCVINGYEFRIINEFDLVNLIPKNTVNFEEFDSRTEKLLRGLYESVEKRKNTKTASGV